MDSLNWEWLITIRTSPNPQQEPAPVHSQIIHLFNLFTFPHRARKARELSFMEEIRTKGKNGGIPLGGQDQAWLGWRAGKGRAWGVPAEKMEQLSMEWTALTALLSLGGHQENQTGKTKEAEQMLSNPRGCFLPKAHNYWVHLQPMGQTVPTEKILKLEPRTVTKKNYKKGTEYSFCLWSCVQWVICQWFWCANLDLLRTSKVRAPKYPMSGSTKHTPIFLYFVWFSIDIFHHN